MNILNKFFNTPLEEFTTKELNELLKETDHYCQCGCGGKVTIFRGKPREFIRGHHKGNWQGGRIVDASGYVFIKMPKHPQANNKGYIREHTLVMEKALGRTILPTEHIHHIDGDRQNNSQYNLIVFKTNSMHTAYEHRLRAFKACGNWEWRKCKCCHQWDDPENLVITKESAYHLECSRRDAIIRAYDRKIGL